MSLFTLSFIFQLSISRQNDILSEKPQGRPKTPQSRILKLAESLVSFYMRNLMQCLKKQLYIMLVNRRLEETKETNSDIDRMFSVELKGKTF